MPRRQCGADRPGGGEQRQRPGRAARQQRRPAAAQNSGYCSTEAANGTGARARMVRAQRNSWRNRARSVVSARWSPARCRPAGPPGRAPRTSRPSTLSSARWSTSAARPPMRASVSRRSAMVAPRQSCRPSARASSAPGRKPWVICAGAEPAGEAARGRQAGVEGGDQAGARHGQGATMRAGSRARHAVAVGDHQDVVLRRRQHVDQVADLAVRAVPGRVDDHGDVAAGKRGCSAARRRRAPGRPRSCTPKTIWQVGIVLARRSWPAPLPAAARRRAAA